jgi:hypothetical protein
MTMITVPGLSKAEAWDGEQSMLPPGDYVFQIEGCAITNAKSSGKPQLELDLVVVAGETETLNGATKKHWVSLSEKAVGRLRALTEAIGLVIPDNDAFDTDVLIGQQFVAEVYADTYKKVDTGTGVETEMPTFKLRKERSVATWGAEATTTAATPVTPAAPTAPARAAQPGPRAPAQPGRIAGPAVRAPIPMARKA